MSFHNQNILIACGEKKDRLQFFNYFDELDAEKIYTATDLDQMHEMLANEEEQVDVLIFEISKQWVQSNNQILDIKVKYPSIKMIGLVSTQVSLNHKQFIEIRSHVDELLFSPVMQHELVAKNVASESALVLSEKVDGTDELEVFLKHYFRVIQISDRIGKITI